MKGSEIVFLAQLYAVALTVDLSIPELRGAALGSLTGEAIQQIDRRLRFDHHLGPAISIDLDTASIEEMMQFPRSIVVQYQLKHTSDARLQQSRVRGQQSPYGLQNLSLGSSSNKPVASARTPIGASSSYTGHPSIGSLQSLEDINTPTSPFLRYASPISHHRSQLVKSSPRPNEASFDAQSMSYFNFRGDSPAHSPAYRDEESTYSYEGNSSARYRGEFTTSTIWG
ncbi:MAG: hypothetical protein Q9190_000345 [Brigantiaea leucoxantha]